MQASSRDFASFASALALTFLLDAAAHGQPAQEPPGGRTEADAADPPDVPVEETLSTAQSATVSDRQVFEGSYFAVYNPITAEDMVRRLPGFSIDEGDDRRGFGATAGNVLINGERPSSKSEMSQQLARISADSVERIELISGTTGGVDVRGQTLLANVVLRSGADLGATSTYLGELRYAPVADRVGWTVRGTRSFRLGGADVLLDLEIPFRAGKGGSDETVFDADGDFIERSESEGNREFENVNFNAAVSFAPSPRDAVNLTASLSARHGDLADTRVFFDENDNVLRIERSRNDDEEEYNVEFGADWERALTDTLSLKLIGLAIYDTGESANLQRRFGPDGDFTGQTAFETDVEQGERVGRAALNWSLGDAHTVEAGFEAAYNFRDRAFASADINAPVTSSFVKELRGEAFIADIWEVAPSLTLESGLTFEASRITSQSEAQEIERELSFPKPRIAATYVPNDNDQFRVLIERDVSQLDFGDFSTSISLGDDDVQIGNLSLEPERTWIGRIEWERRFAERGAVTLAAFYNKVEAVEDFVVIRDSMGDIVGEGPGNIGDGTAYGLEASASLPLDSIGVPGAELRLEGEIAESEVIDPVTGESRPFNFFDNWEYEVEFRQDLPARQFAWGGSYRQEDESRIFRLSQLITNEDGAGDLDLFVETTRLPGVTVRLTVENLFTPESTRERLIFTGLRDQSALEEREITVSRNGPASRYFSLRVSGTF